MVAALWIDPEKCKDKRKIEDLEVIRHDDPLDCRLIFYGFIRDIDYSKGLHILPGPKRIEKLRYKFNAIMICDSKLFSIPQNFMLK